MTNPLDMPRGRQVRAAKKAKMSHSAWVAEQKALQAQQAEKKPDMSFNTEGADADAPEQSAD